MSANEAQLELRVGTPNAGSGVLAARPPSALLGRHCRRRRRRFQLGGFGRGSGSGAVCVTVCLMGSEAGDALLSPTTKVEHNPQSRKLEQQKLMVSGRRGVHGLVAGWLAQAGLRFLELCLLRVGSFTCEISVHWRCGKKYQK